MMDKEHADFDRVYQQIKTPAHDQGRPGRDPDRARAPASAASSTSSPGRRTSTSRARRPASTRRPTSPPRSRRSFDRYYQELIEAIAATDDALLERYLEGGEIARDEAIAAMKEAMKREELFPLFCVSGELT